MKIPNYKAKDEDELLELIDKDPNKFEGWEEVNNMISCSDCLYGEYIFPANTCTGYTFKCWAPKGLKQKFFPDCDGMVTIDVAIQKLKNKFEPYEVRKAIEMTNKDLIELLKREKDVIKIKTDKEEPFTLKSGKKSRLFIDIKKACTNPYILGEILELALDHFVDEEYDIIASVAIGGIPISTALSLATEINQIVVRSEKHDRGTKTQVIGDCKGKLCVLIEDVATTGGSIVNAVKAIRDAGGICHKVIAVVDREEGAEKLCKENYIEICSLVKKSDFGISEQY